MAARILPWDEAPSDATHQHNRTGHFYKLANNLVKVWSPKNGWVNSKVVSTSPMLTAKPVTKEEEPMQTNNPLDSLVEALRSAGFDIEAATAPAQKEEEVETLTFSSIPEMIAELMRRKVPLEKIKDIVKQAIAAKEESDSECCNCEGCNPTDSGVKFDYDTHKSEVFKIMIDMGVTPKTPKDEMEAAFNVVSRVYASMLKLDMVK